MSIVVEIFKGNLPYKKKETPSGWTSFNAPCCHHRGESVDKRQRAGVRFNEGLVYHCFNCGFTASWKPGRQISNKLKNLMRWMGAPDDDINKMVFEALREESPENQNKPAKEIITFHNKDLPDNSKPIEEWINEDLDTDNEKKLADVIAYLMGRNCDPLDENFYWTPEAGYSDRVILPFWYEERIVGYTARKTKQGKPKYISDQHPHFVYNLDSITQDQKYLFVVEGPFDALAVDGVALLHNEISEQQARIINKLGKEVIVIPDQDKAGSKLISDAMKYDWSVAFPTWEPGIKDPASAVEKYGDLFVVLDAIKTSVAGSIKLTLYKKNFEKEVENHALAAPESQ
jgi:hypothetical protein